MGIVVLLILGFCDKERVGLMLTVGLLEGISVGRVDGLLDGILDGILDGVIDGVT